MAVARSNKYIMTNQNNNNNDFDVTFQNHESQKIINSQTQQQQKQQQQPYPNQQQNEIHKRSYGDTLKIAMNKNDDHLFPTKEQAIIIETIEGIKLQEYIEAVAKISGPENIIFASRIPINRICIYLKSKKIAEDITNVHDSIKINDIYLPLQPYIAKNNKFFLSKVEPFIPNSVLREALLKLNINITSKILLLRIGSDLPQLNHILSFRRMFYGHANSIPESFDVVFEEVKYRIYISNQNKKCIFCNKYGHVSENCSKNNKIDNNENDSNEIVNNNIENNDIENKDTENNDIGNNLFKKNKNVEKIPPIIENSSQSISLFLPSQLSEKSDDEDDNTDITIKTNKLKKKI